MYEGYLDSFYLRNSDIADSSYYDHYSRLLSDSGEFVASYTRNFIRKGIDASAIILNDDVLQKKWKKENACEEGDLLTQQIEKFRPDVLWVEDIRLVKEAILSSLKAKFPFIKLLIAYHCAPVGVATLKKFTNFDFVITCTPGLKNDLESKGIRSYIVYHAFDDDLLQKIQNQSSGEKADVVFSGSLRQGRGYHLERIRLLDFLISNGLNLSVYASLESSLTLNAKKILRLLYIIMRSAGIRKPEKLFRIMEYGMEPVVSYPAAILKDIKSPLFGMDMYRLLGRAKIVINNHGEVAGNYAGNMRMFEATGAGSCLLTDMKSNLGSLFDVNCEIVAYSGMDDCLRKIRWLLENENERQKIALAGQKKTLQSHTVSSRCDEMIGIIKSELSKRA
jgi:spore maturation protein CgeB